MYDWRKWTAEQREEILAQRIRLKRPWHSPPHRESQRTDAFLFTASCFNHAPVLGDLEDRMSDFEELLLETIRPLAHHVMAWVVLPNHYHLLARVPSARDILSEIGKLHGWTSFVWNREDNCRGRKVWFRAVETAMKSERHFWATVNYIHHNPVKHRYVEKWQDWPWSSVHQFMAERGREETLALWKEYPVLDYGKDWDD